jgi:hypothetical protein
VTQPWAVPDSPAEQPAAPAVVVAPPPGRRRRAGPDRPEVPVPLRPLTVAERLDGALRILKLAPPTVVALTLAAVVPVELLAAAVLRDGDVPYVRAAFGATIATLVNEGGGAGIAATLLFVVLDAIALAFVAAGLGQLVSGWHVGRRDSTAQVLRGAAANLPSLATAVVLVKLAEGVGAVVLGVGVLLPMTWFALAAPVIGMERAGPLRALRRSGALARRNPGAVFVTCVLAGGVALVLRLSLSSLGTFYADLGLPGEWLAATAFGVAVRLVVDPLVAGSGVLLLLDLRVRHEGLDIELAAIDRFPRAP